MAEPSSVIVKLRSVDAATNPRIQAAAEPMRALGDRAGVSLRSAHEMMPSMHVVLIDPANGPVSEQLARLRVDPEVEYAELDGVRYAHSVPNDPQYANQWFLHAPPSPTVPPDANSLDINSAIDAEHAWDTAQGQSTTIVAVLDTGIRFDHPDLLPTSQGGKVLPGFDFVSGESTTSFVRANDGNGYDSDASDPGDWVDAADQAAHPTVFPTANCDISPSSWHGTRVAGLVGAMNDNATGIAGVAWRPLILPVRVLGKCNGRDSDIINGMRWAAGLHVSGVADNPNPAKIINLSLGSAGTCPQSYRDVIAQLTALGVLVVASAGNESGPVDTPGNCPGVLAVAGLRHTGTKVGFSSFGAEVGVSAPAGNCYNLSGPCLFSLETTTNLGSTTPGANSYTDQLNYNIGTSFSAPIVAGIAALMNGVNSRLGTAGLIARIREGAVAFPSDPALPKCPATDADGQCNCTTSACGAGMVNAARSVLAALRPIALIAPVAQAVAGRSVMLDGSGSVPADGHAIAAYSWVPLGGASVPTGPNNSAITSVTAPASGSASYRLTVTDELGAVDHADATVSVPAPVTSGGSGGGGSLDTLALSALAVAARRRFSRKTGRR
jgi:serine protease